MSKMFLAKHRLADGAQHERYVTRAKSEQALAAVSAGSLSGLRQAWQSCQYREVLPDDIAKLEKIRAIDIDDVKLWANIAVPDYSGDIVSISSPTVWRLLPVQGYPWVHGG